MTQLPAGDNDKTMKLSAAPHWAKKILNTREWGGQERCAASLVGLSAMQPPGHHQQFVIISGAAELIPACPHTQFDQQLSASVFAVKTIHKYEACAQIMEINLFPCQNPCYGIMISGVEVVQKLFKTVNSSFVELAIMERRRHYAGLTLR